MEEVKERELTPAEKEELKRLIESDGEVTIGQVFSLLNIEEESPFETEEIRELELPSLLTLVILRVPCYFQPALRHALLG